MGKQCQARAPRVAEASFSLREIFFPHVNPSLYNSICHLALHRSLCPSAPSEGSGAGAGGSAAAMDVLAPTEASCKLHLLV